MAVDTSVIGKPTGAWKVTVERGPVSEVRRRALQDTNPVYRDADAATRRGLRRTSRAADVHVRDAVLGRVRRGPAARPDRRREPDAHDHGRAVRARARSCCTASRSSSTTARSRSATCSTARADDHRHLREGDRLRAHDVRRHGDGVDGRRPSGDPVVTEQFNLIARTEEVAGATALDERSAAWVDCRTRSRSSPARARASASRTPSGSSPRARRSWSPRSTRSAPPSAMKQLEGQGDVDLRADRHLRRASPRRTASTAADRARSARVDILVNNAALYYDIDNSDNELRVPAEGVRGEPARRVADGPGRARR